MSIQRLEFGVAGVKLRREQRERETERERQRDRETERQRDRDRGELTKKLHECKIQCRV